MEHPSGPDRGAHSAIAIVAIDPEGIVTSWSLAAQSLFDLTAAQACGTPMVSVLDHWAEESDPPRISFSSVLDGDGRISSYVGLWSPGSPTTLSRQSLEASERRFRALVTHSFDAIVVLDVLGFVTFASASLHKIIGVSETEVLGRAGLSFVEPVDAKRVREQVLEAGPGDEVGPIDMRLLTANGTWLPFEGYRTDLVGDPDVEGILWNLRIVPESRLVEQALWRSEERLQALAAGSSDVTVVNDMDGFAIYAGPSLERVFGYRVDDFVGTYYDAFVHPDDLEASVELAAQVMSAGGTTWWARYRIRHADGSWRWVDTCFTDLRDNPAVGGVVANIRDVTEQVGSEQALRESESLYRSMVETAGECITIHDLDGRITFANAQMASLIGSTVAELQQMSIFDLIRPDDLAAAQARLQRRHQAGVERYEFVVVRTDRSTRDVLISASPLIDAHGGVTGILSMMIDISDRKLAEAEMERLVLEDSLTGLASRALVVDRVAQLITSQSRGPGLAAVIFMDLDNFKIVNETHGHSVGDQVLREVASRVRSAVRPQDTVGRYGDDEFVVLLDHLDQISDAVMVADRIVEALDAPISVERVPVPATASLGIALTPADSADFIMRDAEIAMYRAKERGGARFELFDSSLEAEAKDRLAFETDLQAAIEANDLRLHYQPVVDLQGRLTGFEALARWDHPVRGSVSPGQFIPLAETTGAIVPLGRWILNQACSDLVRWRARPGRGALTMAVNLSGRQLVEPGVAEMVRSVLTEHELEPAALCLEITESVLMDDTVVAPSALTAIHELGVRLALDDFGTGYCSLLYLRNFPVDILKLDRSFVSGVDQNPQDSAIVRSTIGLAHSLGLKAVAEGVETIGQLRALSTMGCDVAQGFYWSPGIPAADVEAMLSSATVAPANKGVAVPVRMTTVSEPRPLRALRPAG
jgi:diguanylate cyclase (GGDEF)-like protein/PAS domain S-box-containing protein